MRIFITSIDNPKNLAGGKEVHMALLERGLRQLGVDFFSFYPEKPFGQKLTSSSKREALKRWARRSGIYLFYFFLKNRKVLKIRKAFLKEHQLRRFDLIHSHDVTALLAFSDIKIKKLLTLHGYLAKEAAVDLKNPLARFFIYRQAFSQEKKALKIADYLICVDSKLKDYAISEFSFPADKIFVLKNAVDTETFKPVSVAEQVELKKELGFEPDDFIVLVPRRLVKKNGVLYAALALKQIKDQKVKMIIIGDGPEKEAILKAAQDDSRFKIMGWVAHQKIADYYHLSDAVLIPSIKAGQIEEATSISALEAMACAKPVIASAIGGLKEVIQDQETGLLVPEKEPSKISEAIVWLKENSVLAQGIGLAARKEIEKNYNYLKHAAKVLEIYQSIKNNG